MLSKATMKILKWLVFFIIFAATIGLGFTVGFKYVLSQNTRFSSFETQLQSIGTETPDAIMIVIKQGADTADIADDLKEKGVINNTFAFKFMSKINGFDGRYKPGTHFVKTDMTYDEIMYLLSRAPKTVRITFTEGMTLPRCERRAYESGGSVR